MLAVIVLLGFALRVTSALEPLDVRPGTDSAVYASVAEQLYEHQRFAIPGSASPYDWSPGAPLFYAGVYYATGGVHPGAVRLLVALLGALAIVLVYLIGRRLAGPLAGLVGAGLLAIYPTTIYYTGKLMSEPLATLTLAGAVLSFMWANDKGRSKWAWALPGVLLGLTAFARPEYLAFVVIFALLALWRRGLMPALILARGVRAAGRAVDRARLERRRPLRADQHRRRQGDLHRHLPARQRPAPGRQAGADRARQRGRRTSARAS